MPTKAPDFGLGVLGRHGSFEQERSLVEFVF